ncbi:hypothetical protein OESDEN_15305 [Oesophagostomum dentatum]|uniref:Uncharacterized protein n=1 Tax=Oesophagostomum dentatum TaxID=61180 RepID=A0A0B1SP33_OESDE|nr:hypothetical protein OESDEN_15305 [Oesophagostomum dentatum]
MLRWNNSYKFIIESLVDELAHRDELEYEKEMKNTFISLLLSIQNKRRQFANERKRKGTRIDPSQLPQYMTASIPYNENQHMDNATLASLIKSRWFLIHLIAFSSAWAPVTHGWLNENNNQVS